MGWNVDNIPDLSGKVAVITGANSGLGFESAKAIASAGGHVVMTGRNMERLDTARDLILKQIPEASVETIKLDLASLASIRTAAETIARNHKAIDILLNNAGMMATPEGRTEDGFETQFGINHLGHWVLIVRLMPSLLSALQGRIVTVTSTAHHMGRRIDPDNPNLEGKYGPWKAYGQSKLANYHFAIGLQWEFDRYRLPGQSLSAHPGLSSTNLQVRTSELGGTGQSGPFFERMAANRGMDPAHGALPQLRAATDPKAKGGQLYAPRYINTGVPVRRPILRRIGLKKSIAILWQVSERLTGESFRFE